MTEHLPGPQPDATPPQQPDPGPSRHDDTTTAPPLSGLRNPAAAVRGIGAATLWLEALVLLLALQPMRQLSTVSDPVALTVVGGLVVFAAVTAMTLRRGWGWKLGVVLQVAIMAAGFVHLALLLLGVVFLGIWVYVLRVRHIVLKPTANV